jgi:hypothetical protein
MQMLLGERQLVTGAFARLVGVDLRLEGGFATFQ